MSKASDKSFADIAQEHIEKQIKKQEDDESFDKLMRLMILKMMSSNIIPNNEREVTNINMPIDPDGQVLSLICEIQSSLNQLRTLILSRGRE